ncbi:replication initiation protein RepC [Xaviernesmea oryzae]|uniref:Replication initiation protein RepC n=1 Tax=Xaviernesmea oryzae TaxID=464029 RepID=A0A1Q9B3U5_9HYPH|nr:plasmid replication protein RepC [Xaviernesmea oryzae]OLP62705.1 replication initiation protein RepC [Xaviernesmea oryzae]SEM27017.1 replication initiation protein RepC [Xaviernesmea oryzae]
MQSGSVTTPFGRRPAKLALISRQVDAAKQTNARHVDKWRVFRDACEAKSSLGLQDRALAVLNALLSFYPEAELSSEHALVVFPSNQQLSLRAHGIAETTLRRHLASLVDAGLIQRRDSPNGKRYVHRDRAGAIEQAYGFDLTPLLARADELANLAQEVVAERRRYRLAREALTICRRDVRKLITAAMEEGAEGDWAAFELMYVTAVASLSRSPTQQQVEGVLDELSLLRDEIVNRLSDQTNFENVNGNAGQFERHIQNSKPDSNIELEPSSGKEQGAAVAANSKPIAQPMAPFPLGLVLRACRQIIDYGPGGGIVSWRDMMSAAVVVRSTLGVSPSAYQEACEVMGQENAATAIACILERGGQINSAGGYLRDLTRRAAQGEFSLGPMLMALLRSAGADNVRQVS